MKIFALNVNVVDEIFFQILFVWQENDLVFSSVFKKNKIKNNNIKIAPCPPPPHTHVKIQHAKGSIKKSHGKGTYIFYKTIKLV